MSEMSFEQMLNESFKTIRNGEVVEGTVIDVKPDEITLNIGYKSDGIVNRADYSADSTATNTAMSRSILPRSSRSGTPWRQRCSRSMTARAR